MVIDLIAWASALLCIGVGWFKGLLKMLGRLIVCGCAILLAFVLSPMVGEDIYTSMIEPNLTQCIDDKIEEFGATETVATIYAKIQEFSSSASLAGVKNTISNSVDTASGALSSSGIKDIAGIDWDKLPDLGNNDVVKWISKLATSIDTSPLEGILKQAQSTGSVEASSVSKSITGVLKPPIVGILRNVAFVIILIAVYTLGSFIWGIVRKTATEANPLKTVDRILGAACGLALGLAICLVVGLIVYSVTSGNTDSLTARASNALAGLFTGENIVSFSKIITNTWCSSDKKIS